jgi:hypothetical protein
MLVEVPAPPWMKSVTNWSIMSPAMTRSQPLMMASATVAIERAEIAIGHRGGLLHIAERLHEIRLLIHRDAGDVKVLFAADGLDAVIDVVADLALSEESPARSGSWALLVLEVARVSRHLLAQRLDHEVSVLQSPGSRLRPGMKTLASISRSVAVEALAFLVALALAQPVGARLQSGAPLARPRRPSRPSPWSRALPCWRASPAPLMSRAFGGI